METYARAGLLHRLVRWSGSTFVMARIYGLIQHPLDRLVYRLTGGKSTLSSWLAGVEITMLTTTGAKSGKRRTLPVLALAEGENAILIASNFGRHRNPSWYYNLRANPHASLAVGGISREVVVRELHGDERERGYRLGERIYPGFTQYRYWTHRSIPVFEACPTSN